ncbi:stage II sporulation protein D [Ectobacillus ponti]|uniref:Stage II sporulation protein D n=1 Tax=Ectobacillus ponti TaxID=2961894 RepID=A0AA42BP00_9BACI|nr:stage II sporulation protein D [Ectobacillus ponti]MCP8967886.1 stage II sporulation protein D [Ectobacillus ponti]
MKKNKPIFLLITFLIALVIIVPSLLVLPFHAKTKERAAPPAAAPGAAASAAPAAVQSNIAVAVLRTKQNKVETVPLEQYVAGVISAEMPANFELEALKAQALTARTYVLRKMLGSPLSANKANVTDTVADQVYRSTEELKEAWGKDYDWKMKRIQEAVQGTAGQVLSYHGDLITAFFFSMSNGQTENSEDYWGSPYPYLRSVASPWDKDVPKFEMEKEFSVSQFQKLLGVQTIGKVTEKTSAGRVKTVDFGGKKLSGREVREKLDLRSADFTWKQSGDKVIVTTRGYGHGVGMSQYGANGMAKEGKNYQDIVKHYYQGIEITSVSQYEQKLTAKR